jgi:hypothetical protein
MVIESKSFFRSKPVYENIDGYVSKKYEISITAFVDLHNKEKFEYENLEKYNYFKDTYAIVKRKNLVMDEAMLKITLQMD